MAWTPDQLKAAIAAMSPLPDGMDAIAAALNAETQPMSVDVLTTEVEKIIVPTGEFFSIYQASIKAPSGNNPPTQADQVIAIAWNFYRMLNQWQTIETSSAPVLAAVEMALSSLEAASLISPASAGAITALITRQAPVWQPPVSLRDVWIAQGQPE